MLGMFGAAISLLANVVGASVVGKPPLELIRVYLTFPLGENALRLASGANDVYAIGDGVIVAIGCCLYLGTGMLLGIPFFVALVKFTEGDEAFPVVHRDRARDRFWAINFWGILLWLQPLLIGGNWINDPAILPISVGWATHVVFGWTLALLYPWARFQAYRQPTSSTA